MSDSLNQQIKYLKSQFGLNQDIAKSTIKKANYIINQTNTDWQKSIEEKARKGGHNIYHQVQEI